MDWRSEWKILILIAGVFLACFYIPVGTERFDTGILEAIHLVKWYAREHVLLCLVPAFFIAGAISVFLSQASVMKYLGARANKVLAYSVASVSGTILAVCSCTVLPLFAGIYKMGAGLGPASAFLYSGPAINILSIILTARILGLELGIARAVSAILFSVIIGLCMHLIFSREESGRIEAQAVLPESEDTRPLWQNIQYFAAMVMILVFANWGKPSSGEGLWFIIYSSKWIITSVVSILFGIILVLWFGLAFWKILSTGIATAVSVYIAPHEPMIPFAVAVTGLSVITATKSGQPQEWFNSTWGYAKQMLPLLFFGVLVAGALLGRPEQEGMIPSVWVSRAVGGNSVSSNLFASVAGAFMYFATLTEVPILQGLIGSGMGKGPALALLLAGPALSLPNMLVIRSVMGTRKTVVFITLVIIMATITGIIYGTMFK